MTTKNTANASGPEFSKGHVFGARLFFLAEAALAIYFVFSYRLEIGILYLVYGIISIFLLIPAFRCADCDYYGRRCSLGWGRWAPRLFPDNYRNLLGSFSGINIVFWPLRLAPILTGLDKIIQSIILCNYSLDQHYLFGAYLVILLLQRLLFHTRICPSRLDNSKSAISVP